MLQQFSPFPGITTTPNMSATGGKPGNDLLLGGSLSDYLEYLFSGGGQLQRGRAPSGAALPMPKTVLGPPNLSGVKPPPPAAKPPAPTSSVKPPAGGPPPFVPTTSNTESLPNPSAATTPTASEAPPSRDPRFKPGEAPSLSEPTRGERADFSGEEARIAAMAQGPEGFKQSFYRALLSGISPEVVRARDQERNLQISLAEKNLQQEKEDADRDFARQEDMKDRMYLSQFGERLGKTYGTDTATGLSGFFTPMEAAGLQRSDEQMEVQRQQLDKQLQALANQGGYYAAMADNLRAQAAKADRSEDLALIAGLAANARSGVASDPMGLSGVNWGQELQGTSDMMRQRLGLPGQAPAQGAPPAAPAGPLEQKGLSLGLPPEIAKGLDRLDTPTKRAAALDKLKKDPKYSEFTQVLGQLLGGQ